MFFIELLLLVLGFVMLIKGADWFVDGCSKLASALGVSQMMIGRRMLMEGILIWLLRS